MANGLSDAEEFATKTCKSLSCKHVTCHQRCMTATSFNQALYDKNCRYLFDDWKACYNKTLEDFRSKQESNASS